MEVESLSDDELSQRARCGDRNAIRALIDRHRETVLRIAFRISNDFHAAEEVAQDSFVRAFERIGTFSPERGAFAPWLYQITKNTALNARRKSVPIPLAILPETLDPSDSPDRISQSLDEMRRLDLAIERLDEPYRSTFLLAEIEELPLATIAQMEGIPVGTVKSRVSRAKQALRESLKDINTHPK